MDRRNCNVIFILWLFYWGSMKTAQSMIGFLGFEFFCELFCLCLNTFGQPSAHLRFSPAWQLVFGRVKLYGALDGPDSPLRLMQEEV